MTELFKNLSASCADGIDAYSKKYLSSVREIFPVITNPSLLKSHIKAKDYENAESMLRFSLVFNDLSLFTLTGGKELAMICLQPKWFEDHFGARGATVKVSEERLRELGINPENPEISPAFIFPRGDFIDKVTRDLRPFVEKGKLLIQPERSLFHLKNELNDVGGRNWESIGVSQFSPLESWEIVDEKQSRPIPISFNSDDHLSQAAMFEITVPYLKGVSFHDLSKILEDEGDLVSGLRSSIKQAINECGEDVDPRIVTKDIIDPRVDALNRKFKSIINSHAFRVAGAGLGTVVLAYTAVSTGGLSSAIATVCGGGGLGLLGQEYSAYREKINQLKDDPHYFLWRCKSSVKNT